MIGLNQESCIVSMSNTCNHATLEASDATDPTTSTATAGLKVLANRVLERNSSRNSGATILKNGCNFRSKNVSEKLHYSAFKLYELREVAGDDWQYIKDEERLVASFAMALRDASIIQVGGIPSSYIEDATCRNCGDVKLWISGVVEGCPFCFINNRGKN